MFKERKPPKLVCVPDGIPAGNRPKQCSSDTKAICDVDCKPKECPEVITLWGCHEKSRKLCEPHPTRPEEYEIINKCHECKCYLDPISMVQKCFKQLVPGSGEFDVPTNDCIFWRCDHDTTCPDKFCPPIKPGDILR